MSNKLNKYSIRKFTVGTASILVGATLFLGLNNEAAAQENHENNIEIKQSKSVNDGNPIVKEEVSSEVEADNAPVENSKNTEKAVSTEEKADNAPVRDSKNTEKAVSTEEKADNAPVRDSKNTEEAVSTEEKTDNASVRDSRNTEKAVSTEEKTDNASVRDSRNTEEAVSTEEKTDNASVRDSRNTEEAVNNRKIISNNLSKISNNELKENEKATIIDKLEKTITDLSEKEIEKVITSEVLKNYSNKKNNQPTMALRSMPRSITSEPENKSSLRLARSANDNSVTVKGTDNFNFYGDVIQRTYPEEFPDKDTVVAINPKNKPSTGSKGALEYKNKIDFRKDFTINIPIANNNQGNTTGADGWGFIFTEGNGQDFLNKGGILRDKGIADAFGFKIDTSFNNVLGTTDPIDADKKNNLSQIGGASKIGYGAFVRNGADGISKQVGSNALGSKDKPVNKIQYADNTTNIYDGKFHGQRFNDVVLSYNADNGKLTATYAGKIWESTLSDLGADKTKNYNFLITSSHMINRYSYGIMRTDLESLTITTPQDSVIAGTPEVQTEEVPFETKREFNPNLEPGTEQVKQKGKPGEKTITTPITVNPITGEKVGEGEPTVEVTTPPVDEIIEYGGEKIPQGHKDEFDPNLPVDTTEEKPGKPGVKNPDTGEVVVPPVDDVTKVGPKTGTPEVQTEEVPFETKREFNPNLEPGTEQVKQKGKPGEKTFTTPITVNPITGEKVGEGEPTVEVTTPPVDEIIEYGGEKIPQGHKDEFDPNLPVDTTEEKPGKPGVKNPDTGEVVVPPVDDVTKVGPKTGTPEVQTEEVPFETKREFNPNLEPGTEQVKQKGKPGEKTITTPITVNPITGEKVGEGEPTVEVTTPPVDEIIEYGGEKIPQGHKDEFDPNLPVDTTEEKPGKPGVKNPDTGEVVVPPVDDVTKVGPKTGTPEVQTEEVPFETKREFNPNLEPGTEQVKQKGKPGEKTITTPITVNPITGEKVGEGEPTVEVTTPPVDEIIEYGGEKIPQGHKDEFDPNLPVDTTEEKPGKPGVKNPDTGEVVVPPVDDVTKVGPKTGTPEVQTEEVPFETKREFNPNLEPGTEQVKQKGKPGEKTITTPITVNPITGEKVGEGEPTVEVTTPPVDEIIEYGGEKIPQGHKDEFDPNLPVDTTEEKPGKPGVKNPDTGEVVVPPVDDVTKVGPKTGTPEVQTEEVPFETKREFNPNLEPGTEQVKQKGKPGEKTITTPITVNPITGEKVGEGEPTVEVTTPPVDEIIEYGGEKIPQGHKDEFDPNLPVDTTEEKPGKPGVKNPDTGEVVVPPVDDVTKVGPKTGTPEVKIAVNNKGPLNESNIKQKSDKKLPDTGEATNNDTMLFGSLFTGLGLLLFGRRKKQED
ncbi:E domain-containing protein [Mammaliicoccus stepanovicii]|uniref:E domain-containing protein n=3 Tax=Mammaliicoccus stepanovicii TaxID=643214 RepID=UPI0038B8F3E2